jgi:hypothetical protein
VTTFVRKVPCARGQRRKSSFFLFRDMPRVFLTRARKGLWGQKSKVNRSSSISRSQKWRTDLVCCLSTLSRATQPSIELMEKFGA